MYPHSNADNTFIIYDGRDNNVIYITKEGLIFFDRRIITYKTFAELNIEFESSITKYRKVYFTTNSIIIKIYNSTIMMKPSLKNIGTLVMVLHAVTKEETDIVAKEIFGITL